MDGSAARQSKQDIESQLLEELSLRQTEWRRASEGDRDVARQRFMNALLVFNSLVLDGQPPKKSSPPAVQQ